MTIQIDLKALSNKRVQLIVTLALCAAIILSGTFAWFSVTQNVRNEFFGFLPRVNLHDDFNEPNKDIYVENTSGEPVLVRVKLLEYMEWGPTSDPDQNKLPGSGADREDTSTWSPHHNYTPAQVPTGFEPDPFHDYWTWTAGGGKWYVPATDAQATAEAPGAGEADGRIVQDPRTDAQWKTYLQGLGILDQSGQVADPELRMKLDTLDDTYTRLNEMMNLPPNPGEDDPSYDPHVYYWNAVDVETARKAVDEAQRAVNDYLDLTYARRPNGTTDESRRVRKTRGAAIYTMEKWVGLGSPLGDFWVIDADGWAYWASPLENGSATGLLVDSVTASELLNSEIKAQKARYYYAIDVSMQAATAEYADPDDPTDYENYSGFWRHPQVVAARDEASPNAQALLTAAAQSARADGTGGGAAVMELALPEKGAYWYLEDGEWRYDDGRWTYDGMEWLLDGGPYPFDNRLWISIGGGEWQYCDDEWFFDSEAWYYILQEPAGPTETPPAVIETPPPGTETPPVATEPPPGATEAPPTATVPPPVETEAPPTATVPPPVETEAPPAETAPPPVETQAPPAETAPPVASEAPPVETEAPSGGMGQEEQTPLPPEDGNDPAEDGTATA